MYGIPTLSGLLALVLCLYSSTGAAVDRGLLRLATTSSVQHSGLLQRLVNRFERESGYQVKVHAVGSGAALRMGRRGLADAIISHAPEAEGIFMNQGHGAVRRPLMRNDFVLVGPAGDPAAIGGLSDVVQAFSRIAARRQTFISRADESGTHRCELKLWRIGDRDPFGKSWYLEAGMGMGDTLELGSELQGYLLVDRGTWLAMRSTLNLVLLSFGDGRLINPYSVMAVSQSPHLDVNEEAGRAFVEWITSNEVQRLIGAFRVDGKQLFIPVDGAR